MSDRRMTPHATARFSQRGIATDDLEVAFFLGREVEGGIIVLKKDAERVAQKLEAVAKKLRGFSDLRIVMEGCLIKTGYFANRKTQRRILRHSECRNMED